MKVKFSEISAPERDSLPDSKFAFIDKDGNRKLPIHDANHVRAALSRLSQTDGMTAVDKKNALAKINAAAKKFGVQPRAMSELDWDDDDDDDEPTGIGSDPDDDANYHADPVGNQDAIPADVLAPRTGDPDNKTPGPVFSADEGGGNVGGLTISDVHVPAPMGPKKKRAGSLKNLVNRVRTHLGTGRLLAKEDFERMYRQSIGATGGKGKQAAEEEYSGLQSVCCGNACGQCDYAGCGCCEDCHMVGEPGSGDGSPQEGVVHTFGESAHWTAPDGTGVRMFLPFSFTEFGKAGSEWIQYMPMPGRWDSPNYGVIEITKQANEDFVTKFNNGAYQKPIPVDGEHNTKLSGAMGWIDAMRLSGDGSIDAHVSWTDRGMKMLAERRYRFFSPEWYDHWADPATGNIISNVAIGGALTTRPFFKPSSLKPVIASEGRFTEVNTEPKGRNDMAGENTAADAKRFAELQTENNKLREDHKALTEMFTSLEKNNTSLKALTEAAQADAKAAGEAVASMRAEARRREFTEIAGDFAGETAKHVALMERFSDEDRAIYIEMQKGQAELLKASKVFSSIGVGTSAASAGQGSVVGEARQFAEKAVAAAVAAGTKLTVERAMSNFWSAYPDKYAEYVKETGN